MTAQVYGSSVIALGAFNPAIVSPDWLEHHKLIGTEDAEIARQGRSLLITHQVAQFEGPYFALQVIENQFALTSKGAMTPLFRDLFVGMLQLLPQTPVTALGLNFTGHYKLDNVDDYHAIGDVLAPKSIWSELFPGSEQAAGLANLTIRVDPMSRDSTVQKSKSHKHVTLQPSTIVKHGVFLSYNDHHDISKSDQSESMPAERAAAIVDSEWDSCNSFAKDLFDKLIAKSLRAGNRR
jgi:hypothetical protein